MSRPSSATVEAVCAAYPPEWQKTMDKLTQVKQCHEAELAQSRQEGFMEAEQAADERFAEYSGPRMNNCTKYRPKMNNFVQDLQPWRAEQLLFDSEGLAQLCLRSSFHVP
ncbi:uncharacterized protein F5147DRAFT_777842 [Suillus discolor]|uniref:Uncharacterized protein n=1 Tax=Suillus discolor TaxID=1912936 RepID=A0A9P7EZ06_9AGAM|nr:uncharacterized protein F5147DRAFT_777842 [Suillus discolor]KAG2097979.1 hypothetical protein F5147DRAFT_777842 [Suillus discolor]